MHGSRSKIPSKNLFRERCAEEFNSGVKGLMKPFLYRFHMMSMEYSIDVILPQYGPWFDSASDRSDYQKYFIGVKIAGA
jgi:hypothetical protein